MKVHFQKKIFFNGRYPRSGVFPKGVKMKKRTVDEKLKYNKGKESGFSHGYCAGVTFYRNYGNVPFSERPKRNADIDEMRIVAKRGYSYGKGFMCGVRDAANERKEKVKGGKN